MAWYWNPVAAFFVRLDRSFVIEGVDGIEVCESDVAIEALIPFQEFSSVGCHTAHDGGHGARCTVVTFVGDFTFSDLCEEIDVLLGPTVFAVGGLPHNFVLLVVDLATADIAPSVCTVSEFAHRVPAAWDVTALAQKFGAVFVGEFNEVVIEDLTTFFAGADLASTLALGFDGRAVHEPVDHIEVMDVLFADVVTGEPVEVIPIVQLVFEFGLVWLTISGPNAVTIPVSAGQDDIADSSFVEHLDGRLVIGLVVALQSNGDGKFLFFGDFVGFEDTSNSWGICCDRFFHEDVFAGFDGSFEVKRAEAWRAGQDDQVDVRGKNFFIAIDTDKSLGIDVVFVFVL